MPNTPSLFKAGPGSYVQYLLLDNHGSLGQAPGQALPIDPVLGDRVLGMPGKLGIAHQDHVSDIREHRVTAAVCPGEVTLWSLSSTTHLTHATVALYY